MASAVVSERRCLVSLQRASDGRTVQGHEVHNTIALQCSAPIILGSYKRELHNLVDWIAQRSFDLVVDIGAAGGYYAVGVALRMRATRVIAFEMDGGAADACRKLVKLNV